MPVGAARLGFWYVQPDALPPLPQFPNLGFEQGINGWTVAATRIRMGGLSNLAGWPTPADPMPNPYGSTGDATTILTMPSFNYSLNTVDKPPLGEVQSMQLTIGSPTIGIIDPPGALVYGPALYSNFYIEFNAGDSVGFDWRAEAGQDAYNIYAYMVEKDTGNYVTLLRSSGLDGLSGTTWQSTIVPVAATGAYKFVFVSGSWDSTFGMWIGGKMLIDNIRRIQP